jgi:hypothetical protein
MREQRPTNATPDRREVGPEVDDQAADTRRAARVSAAVAQREFSPTASATVERGEAGVAGPSREVPHRAQLEQAIGADFSDVRAHTDPQAQEACVGLGAEAYALGNDVAFLEENPAPEVVAHELAHTIQQGGHESGVQPLAEAGPDTDAEGQADAVADHVARGAPGPARQHVRSDGLRAVRRRTGVLHKFDAWAKRNKIDFTGPVAAKKTSVETFGGSETTGDEHMRTDAQTASFDWSNLSVSVKDEYTIDAADSDKLRAQIEQGRDIVAEDKKRLAAEQRKVAQREMDLGFLIVISEDPEEEKALLAEQKKVTAKRKILDEELEVATTTLDTIKGQLDRLSPATVGKIAGEAGKTARDYSKRSLYKQSTIWTVDTKSIGVKSSTSASERDADGVTSTTTTGQHDSVAIGEGVTGKRSSSSSHTLTDSAGNTMHEKSRESEVSGGVVMKEDGTVGISGGAKLKDAIKDQHGNSAFVERSATGSYTVNIIAVPDRDPPEFAVVSTLSLGGEVGVGAGKEKEGKRGKGSASVSAGASASVEITHTHLLSAGQARKYIEDLDAADQGKPTEGKMPEFALLQRAHAGVMSGDEAAGAVQSLFGNPTAAATMADEESIEMTTKVGARAGAALAGEGAGGSKAGAEGGVATEVYRSLKVARLPSPGDSKLMEVTVAFGGKDTMHGALTASGLGVSAKVGGKQWGSADELLTFRLDASEPDYAELYQEVVGCMTPGQLMAMRSNPRYKAHVARYTTKQAHGGDSSFEVGPASGIAAFGSERSHSRSTEVTKEDDGFQVTDAGGSTDTTRLTLGPVDVLRSDRAETAEASNVGGRQFVNIGEATTETSVQWELPGFKELITAESPAKAVKKAMELKRTRMVDYHLDDAALDKLVGRAYDSSGWSAIAARHYNPNLGRRGDDDRWQSLRTQLIKPTVSKDIAAWDPAAARSIARASALCDFMAGSYDGFGFVQGALREWNDGDSVDIGVMYEWPPTLIGLRQPVEQLRKRVALVDLELEPFKADEDEGRAKGLELVASLQANLDKYEPLIRGCGSFSQARAKIEILNDFDLMRNRLIEQRREFLLGFGDGTRDEHTEAKNDKKMQLRRKEQLESLCLQAKAEEITLFGRAGNASRKEGMFGKTVLDKLAPVLEEVRELHVTWIERVKELRHVCLAACLASSEWTVSAKRGDERTGLEPAEGLMKNYLKILGEATPFGMADWGDTGLVKMMSNRGKLELYDY